MKKVVLTKVITVVIGNTDYTGKAVTGSDTDNKGDGADKREVVQE